MINYEFLDIFNKKFLRFCMTNLAQSACWSRDDSGTVMTYAWYFHVSGKSSIIRYLRLGLVLELRLWLESKYIFWIYFQNTEN